MSVSDTLQTDLQIPNGLQWFLYCLKWQLACTKTADVKLLKESRHSRHSRNDDMRIGLYRQEHCYLDRMKVHSVHVQPLGFVQVSELG